MARTRARRPGAARAGAAVAMSLRLLVCLLVLGVRGAGGATGPLHLAQVCHARGSASAWVSAKDGSLVTCAGAIETNGTRAIYAPDVGAPIIVVMPPGAGAGVDVHAASPRCLLQTDRAAKDLSDPVILISHTMTAGVRHALLCPVPPVADAAFPGGAGPPPRWAKLKAQLDFNAPGSTFYPVDGLEVWFFGLTAPPLPAATWSGGGALITLMGYNLAVPGAGGSGGEDGGGGTAGAAAAITGATVSMTCRFYLNPTIPGTDEVGAGGATNVSLGTNASNTNASASSYEPPWYVLMSTGGVIPLGGGGSDSVAVEVTRNTTVCPLPPLPRGFVPPVESILVAVSPDPYTIRFCNPRNLSLVNPIVTSSTVGRSSREGGFVITLAGRGFPSASLASCTPRVSFGSAVVSATFGYGSGNLPVLVCAVPTHEPALVPLSVSFDGQTFVRGDARFAFYDTVTISSLSPSAVPHTGMASVTLSGRNFQPVTSQHGVRCKYTGTTGVESGMDRYTDGSVRTSSEGNKVVCQTPAISVTFGTWNYLIAVSFNVEGNPSPLWSQGAALEIFTSPSIDRTVPRMISAAGGTTMTLIGSNFKDTGTAACRFSTGLTVKSTFSSSQQIQCVIPATEDRLPRIFVCVTLNGVDCSDNFALSIYAALSVFPAAVPQSGGLINATLNGVFTLHETEVNQNEKCSNKNCVRVRFRSPNGFRRFGSVSEVLGGVIVCAVPANLDLGSQELELSLNGGWDWVAGNLLQMYRIPQVASIHPCAGPLSGASVVTLRGTDFFHSDTLPAFCSFGGVFTAAVLSGCQTNAQNVNYCTQAVCSSADSNTSAAGMVRYVQPRRATGQGVYNVTLSLALNSVQPTAVGTFVYYRMPELHSVFPSACPNTGASFVTVSGRDMTGGYNGSRFCRFMPLAPTNHERLFLDPEGSTAGDMPPDRMVTPAHYSILGAQLVCSCPANPRVIQQHLRLVVSLNGQHYDGAGLAAVVHAPVQLHTTTPLSGDMLGSTIVYATGANFVQGDGLQMIFGTQSVPATVLRDGLIKALSPQVTELVKVPVRVSNNNGVDLSAEADVFEYFSAGTGCPVEKETQKTCHWRGLFYGECDANECVCRPGYWGKACALVPATSAVFPRSGVPAGGTTVSVRGLFLGGECCSLAPIHASVPFPLQAQSDAMLKVRTSNLVLPATYENETDALVFTVPEYPAGSSISFDVSFDGGARYIAAPDTFRFEEGPSVASFNPTVSPLGGDTVITITGARFWDNAGLSCRFGNAGETRALWVSTSMLKCATSPFFSRPVREPSPPPADPKLSDGNLDVMECQGHNSAACVTAGVGLCMWRHARCVPVYAPRNATTGLQTLSVSTNGQEYTALLMPIHYYNESAVFDVQPTFGAVTGGTIVTVTGPPDFIPSPEARCRFGNAIVETTVTTSTVRCASPPIAAGQTVSFTVALDGQHFVCVPSDTNGQCSYFYFEKVRIVGLFPSVGATVGGLRVTVTGEAFLPFSTARCRFGNVVSSFDVVAGSSGSCVSPAAASPGRVNFAVTINGVDEEIWSSGFEYYRIPTLSQLQPNGAAVAGSAAITVVGQDFQEFADHLVLCRLVSQAAVASSTHAHRTPSVNHSQTLVASSVSNGMVVCTAPCVPSNASGGYLFQVSLIGTRTADQGLVAVGEEWSASLHFAYYDLPIMHALSPVTGGKSGGTPILAFLSSTVKLDQFARCVFEARRGDRTVYTQGDVVSNRTVACVTPAMSEVQDQFPSVRVALNGQDLTAARSHMFTYVEEAAAEAVMPTMTTQLGGTLMRITGSNFAVSYWSRCVFRGSNMKAVLAPATVVSSGEARCLSPSLSAPGPFTIAVSPSDAFEGSGVSLVVAARAHVTSLLPSHGLLQGSTSVTVKGENFIVHKTPICLFGLRMVEGLHVDQEHIVCSSPPSPVARLFRVLVSVSLDGGVSYFNSSKTYEYYPLLSVVDLYPQLGVAAGGTLVTVRTTGTRNVSGVMCRFGSKKVPGLINANSAEGYGVLTCVSPEHAEGLALFAVSLNGQDAEFALASPSYLFHRPLVPRAIWPTAGPIFGGTIVTLSADQGSRSVFVMGPDFVERSSLLPPDPMPASVWAACKVGDEVVPGQQASGRIECRVPACTGLNASGRVRRLEVSVNGQEFAAGALYRFQCVEMPVVHAVVPSMGPAEAGSRVTLYGSNFTGTSRSRCAVGNLSRPAQVVSSTMAYCNAAPILPKNVSRQARDLGPAPDATAGPTGVLGMNWVTLAVDGQHYSTDQRGNYTYYPSASVRHIDPPSASTLQGAVTVTVFGHGFKPHNASFAQCRFGDVVVRAHVNSSGVLECRAPPVSRGAAVLVELSFNRYDFESHNSVFFLRLAPAPQVSHVAFTAAMHRLQIQWLNATDRATFRSPSGASQCGVAAHLPCGVVYGNPLVGPFECGLVMEVSAEQLGYGASCRWRDNETLVVSLGASPTLLPGGSLLLLPSAVMQGSQLSSYTSAQLPPAALPRADQLPAPVAILSAPSVVGACQDLVLDGSMSYNHAGRAFNFSWALVSPTNANISQVLAAHSGSERDPTRRACRTGVCSKVMLPSGLLTTPQRYTFQLSVTSWVGLTGAATVTVTKSSDANVAAVRILAPATWRTRAGLPLVVVAHASHQACSAASASAIALQWSVKELLSAGAVGSELLVSPAILTTSHTLRLPPYSLSPSKQYIIAVTASALNSASTASTTVTVTKGRVVAWISGGDRQVAHDQDLWLDASASFDPDAASLDVSAPLIFSWSCQVRSAQAGAQALLPCASLVSNFTLAGAAGSRAHLPLSTHQVGQQSCAVAGSNSSVLCWVGRDLVFTVNVSRADGSGASAASVRVRVEHANTTLLVNISSVPCATSTGRCKLNVAQPITLKAFLFPTAPASSSPAWLTEWSTVEGDVDISRSDVSLTDAGSLTLVLRPNVLSEGAVYTFRLRARRSSALLTPADAAAAATSRNAGVLEGGYAQVVIECNAAPSGGRFLIDRTQGEALTSNFTLTALGWSDDAEDMPLTYSFAATAGNASASNATSTATAVISGSLLPQHLVRLPVGLAPLYGLDLELQVEDALGAVATQRACWLEFSESSSDPMAPCRVAAAPPAATRNGVLAILEGFGPMLQRAAGSQQVDLVMGLVGAMLSLLNSEGGSAGARRLVQVSASFAQAREIRDTLVDSVAALVQPEPRASLLGVLQLETLAGLLKSLVFVPAEISPSSLGKMAAAATSVLRGLSAGVASAAPGDIAVTVSSLRQSLVYSRVGAQEVSGDAALQLQDALEECASLLMRTALAAHVAGQAPEVLPSRATAQSEFEVYGRVVPVQHGGSVATLKTNLLVHLGGQTGWGAEAAVTVSMPDVALAEAAVRAPLALGNAPPAAAAVDVVVAVWRHNATFVRDVMGSGGAASDGALLGRYVSVALYWHGVAESEGKIKVDSLATPLRLGMSAVVPNTTLDATTGCTSNVAVCAFLEDSGRSWGVRGMSFALNSSSVSPYSARSSTVAAGRSALVVCEAWHLTSFSVRAETTGCDDVPRSPLVLDRCRVCGGNNSCVDCADAPFGGKVLDPCGICGGSNALSSCLGCDGVIYPPGAARVFDDCQVCGGNGNHKGCDGTCDSALALDECGLCGGDGSSCKAEGLFVGNASRQTPALPSLAWALCTAWLAACLMYSN